LVGLSGRNLPIPQRTPNIISLGIWVHNILIQAN